MPFFVGIDGGGTKTRCLVGDESSLLGAGSSAASKLLRVGEACTQNSLAAAIHEACVAANISPRAITSTCAGVTGASHAEVAKTIRRLVGQIVGGNIEVVGDMEIALEGALGRGAGVVVVAGTGSIAYGRNRRGETARSGGWGSVVSDEGSGYWVGVNAIRAALRAQARGNPSPLLEKFMLALGASSLDQFIARANGCPPPDFASLFPMVLKAATEGEPVAAEVLSRAGRALAGIAEDVIARLFHAEDIVVAGCGGVFASSMQLRQAFSEQLRARVPGIQLVSGVIDPAFGALTRARRGTVA
ncbi:MAG: hypothetical protein JO356_02715 [Acidobacteria bacterium]|nr:hypothetical protein [Acidobacteriota bacterium]